LTQSGHKESVNDADAEADQCHQSRTPFQTRAPMIHGYTEFTRETTIELSVPSILIKK
jgi:hypothetical protein